MRIVSLLASATEIVCALGAGDMLVGRSHECDNPAWVKRLPACSEPAFDVSVSSAEIDAEVRRRLHAGEPLYRIHLETIRGLEPDLVITQSHCEVCAITPADVAASGLVPARQISVTAFNIEDIFDSILRIASELGLEERGREVAAAERERLTRVREAAARHRRPTVVMLEWADPLFAMGNWGPELIAIANGEALLGKAGEYSSAIPAGQLQHADPEYLIVAPCGYSLDRALRELPVLERHSWWPKLRAVRERKVFFADGNLFFNRSGMTVSRTAEIIAEILHGETLHGETPHGCSFGASEGVATEQAWVRAS
jgi:iron complex transport system substrate-binding protein